MQEYVELVRRSLDADARREFDRRVDEQAAQLISDHDAGRLDSPTFATGMELEVYAVDESNRLVQIPASVFGDHCDKELGRHNAEFQTDPNPLDADGLADQADQLRQRFRRAREAAADAGVQLVLDAMWTVPPPGGSAEYLGRTESHDEVAVSTNMTPSPRYYALDNAILERAGGSVPVSVPGVDHAFPTILVESLTSSVQPHLQVPDVETFPRYHNLAIRTLGPVLALTTNSPLLPVDLYDAADPYRIVEETYHELRIPVFEQSINEGWEKVKFPDDVVATTDVVDNLVDDPTPAPFLREWLTDDPDRETFADRYWELDHKRGTYWRWLRAVTGGQPVGGGDEWSVRLEYRPLPTQPTIADNLAVQALVAGLLRGLAATDHPLETLDHESARECFYDVVERGLDADIAWVTAEGERTTNPEMVYPELFDLARTGLREQGVPPERVESYLDPLQSRWERRLTPSRWKLTTVRRHLDSGASFVEAVSEMQSAYVRRAGDTDSFSTWDSGDE
jgi:hypothetical protein